MLQNNPIRVRSLDEKVQVLALQRSLHRPKVLEPVVPQQGGHEFFQLLGYLTMLLHVLDSNLQPYLSMTIVQPHFAPYEPQGLLIPAILGVSHPSIPATQPVLDYVLLHPGQGGYDFLLLYAYSLCFQHQFPPRLYWQHEFFLLIESIQPEPLHVAHELFQPVLVIHEDDVHHHQIVAG